MQLQANENVRSDALLQIGNVQETVTVDTQAAQVDTRSATLNHTVDSKSMVELPLPEASDRERLHAIIFDELVQGRIEPASRAAVVDVVRRGVSDQGADSVILGCTEFALLVAPADLPVPAFDTTGIHAEAGMDFALAR